MKKGSGTLIFMKTRDYVDTNEKLHEKGMMILDEDTPHITDWENVYVMPFSVKSFPKVFSRMTASKAGEYAMAVCKREKWDITKDNLEACLAQLEMEF